LVVPALRAPNPLREAFVEALHGAVRDLGARLRQLATTARPRPAGQRGTRSAR